MRIAVSLHIFYEEIARDILLRLKQVGTEFHLFVTHSVRLSRGTVETIKEIGCDYTTIEVSNVGRDILPFLDLLRGHELDPFDLVWKLHTKRDHPTVGARWRNACLDALLGDRLSQSITAMTANPQLIMIGPDILYISARDQMYGNQSLLEEMATKVLRRSLPEDWGFFAGTMFCARTPALRPLAAIPDGFQFESENDKTDGQVAHAVERLFGLLPLNAGGKIATVSELEPDLMVFEAPGLPHVGRVTLALGAQR
jgi:lipopolysaccharide biosynthesis protein